MIGINIGVTRRQEYDLNTLYGIFKELIKEFLNKWKIHSRHTLNFQ